jgi:uncharacterized membrane-anchored protein YjiN (DUF445 family)
MNNTPSKLLITTLSRERNLAKMKWIATGLFGVAAVLYVMGSVFARSHPAWNYLVAFAEAAMVGALADWFAVVALFRHPLGLAIPHTAIIPSNKNSIAQSLSEFVVMQFLSTEAISTRLKRYDAAQHAAHWLAQTEHQAQLVEGLKKSLGYGIHALDTPGVQQQLCEMARHNLQGLDWSSFLANGIELVTVNDSHRKILQGGLHRFAEYVEHSDNTEQIAHFIKNWSDNAFVQSMIEPFVPTIRAAVTQKIRAAAEDTSNALYQEFDLQVHQYIERLKQDDGLRDWLAAQKMRWLNSPEFAQQISTWWEKFHTWAVSDLQRDESVIAEHLASLLNQLTQQLATNVEMQSWLNEHIQTLLIQAATANKSVVGELIRDEVLRWEDHYMVKQLELFLGKDLQYIRINGTLVGGVFGLLIYALTQYVMTV